MLTEVILEGEMGKEFGREWKLLVSTPAEALRLIQANNNKFVAWIRSNRDKIAGYGILCENENGITEEINNDNFIFHRKMKRITFYPVIAGAGGHTNWTQVVEGAALIALAFFAPEIAAGLNMSVATGAAMGSTLTAMGATLVLQGFITGLTQQPSSKNTNSFYFDGAVNTTSQGNPVPLVYGRMLTGSQAISVSLQVDQMM